MEASRKAHIVRLLFFWLDGQKITDPEYVLQQIALESGSTRDEVWEVYCELTQAALYKKG